MEAVMIDPNVHLQHLLRLVNATGDATSDATGVATTTRASQTDASAGDREGTARTAATRSNDDSETVARGVNGSRSTVGSGVVGAGGAAMQQADNSTTDYLPGLWSTDDESLFWNASWVNSTTAFNYSEHQVRNGNGTNLQVGYVFCAKWVDAQQDLFQTANLCFAFAFLIPKNFKQSILLMRALCVAGFVMLAMWAGVEICSPDVLGWNLGLIFINSIHTVLLIIRFLPPALSLELTELYLKLFKPLKVSKKHFQELAKEARVLKLDAGDAYAVEDVTPADERLSILLKGKLRVSCEQTHLHYIHPHQFVDSPEWEANREQSDDVFQVTIIAEEGCTYLCWPRMRLERVLRHRPMLKVVVDSIIGKDITHKLYSLNEGLAVSAATGTNTSLAPRVSRSVSVDAVHESARGRLRSRDWRDKGTANRNPDVFSPGGSTRTAWKPMVASQFPKNSPFTMRATPPQRHRLMAQTSSSSLLPSSPLLAMKSPPRKTASFRKQREVKFVEPPATPSPSPGV